MFFIRTINPVNCCMLPGWWRGFW